MPASSITATGGQLNGSVNPEGLACTYWFVWGTGVPYTFTTATGSAGSGTIPQTVQATLTGLATGTTYHYAVVAQTAAGTVTGADTTFVAAVPAVVPVASSPVVPFTVGPVETPHLAYPLVMLGNQGAGGPQITEQDTQQEVFSCVRMIADCPIGACSEMPSFGIPDLTFSDTPLDPTPLISAIEQLESRAAEDAVVSLLDTSPTGGNWQVALTTTVQPSGS